MKIKRIVKPGDILKIPAGPESFAIGQVILQPDNDFEYVAIYDLFVNEETNITFQQILNAHVLILTQVSGGINTIPNQRKWEVIGNIKIRDDIRLPEFKVHTRNGWVVTNWKNETLRSAADDEIADLKFHEYFSAAAIEETLRAYLELETPSMFYEKLIQKPKRISNLN